MYGLILSLKIETPSLEEASSNSLTILVSTLEEELQAILSGKEDEHTSPDEPSPPTKNTHDLTPD